MAHFAEIDRAVPRPDQEEALAAVAAWASAPTGRGQLIEAPGTGKTLLAHWVAERLNPPLVVYAAPSLSLLDQTLRMWAGQQPDGRVQRLVVCSDTTVADDLPAARLTIPPTTDLAHIRAWLGHAVPPGTQRQVFVTYQSAARVGAALRDLGTPVPLLLADEAHRLAAPGPSQFRAVLDDRLFPTRRRLFLTGTPRVGRVRGPDGRLLEPELSLDDRSRFGPVLHRLSFAVAGGSICGSSTVRNTRCRSISPGSAVADCPPSGRLRSGSSPSVSRGSSGSSGVRRSGACTNASSGYLRWRASRSIRGCRSAPLPAGVASSDAELVATAPRDVAHRLVSILNALEVPALGARVVRL